MEERLKLKMFDDMLDQYEQMSGSLSRYKLEAELMNAALIDAEEEVGRLKEILDKHGITY